MSTLIKLSAVAALFVSGCCIVPCRSNDSASLRAPKPVFVALPSAPPARAAVTP